MEEQFIDKRRCKGNYGSDLYESNITDFSTDNDEVVKVVTFPFLFTTYIRVLVKVGTEMEQTLIPLEDKVSIEYRDNVKIMSFDVNYRPYSSAPPFSNFFKSNFRGIGNGWGKCHLYIPPGDGSLEGSYYTRDLNEDCVERDAFLNRCYNFCEPPSRGSEWYWEKAECGECGNPPC